MPLEIVNTMHGQVAGVPQDGVIFYKGVPYAAPPVGELRWRPPVDPEPWEGVRVCDTYAPAAIQQFHSDWFTREGFYPGHYDEVPPMSEDCLYLNVATAAETADERRPVYIWFHGGGLTNGNSAEVTFDPRGLAQKGIVVVSVGQRLGVLGYLALPQLTAERGTSGNYGLMDELQALDWVTANIEAFGGDPENITVGGQSGGAQKIAAMVASPHSGDRIRRVVSQSGLNWLRTFSEPDQAEAQGRAFLAAVGVDPDAGVDELRALDPSVLNRAVPRDVIPQTMVHDGDLLPFSSVRDPFVDSVRNVDFLSGTTLGEANTSSPSLHADPSDELPPVTDVASLHAHFRELLGDLYDLGGFADLPDVVGATDESAPAVARWLGTAGLAGGRNTNISRSLMVDRTLGAWLRATGTGGTAYSYVWSHRVPTRPEDLGTERDPTIPGAWHASDLFYAFRSLELDAWPGRPWTPADHELADTVSSYFANFMRTGDPNGPGLPEWPSSNDDHGWVEIGHRVEAHTGVAGPLDRLVAAFVAREYGLEQPSVVPAAASTGGAR